MGKINRGALALIVAVIIWGSTFMMIKVILTEIPPFTLIAVRFLLATIVISPFAFKEGFQWQLIFKPTFLLFGLTGVALFYGLETIGLTYTSAGNAALFQACIPAATAGLSFLILKERLGKYKILGIILSTLGVIIISLPSFAAGGQGSYIGDILVLGSVLSWAAYTIHSKILTARYSTLVTTTASFASGTMMLLPLAFIEWYYQGIPSISIRGWSVIIYLACFASAIAFFLWNYALRFLSASTVAPYANLIPVIGLATAILYGEATNIWQIVGGVIVLFGLYMCNIESV